MVAFPRQSLILPIAPLAGAMAGILCAGAVAALPAGLLEGLVSTSGLPALVAAAEPPLGLTARIALALATGLGTALFVWSAIYLLFGARSITLGGAAPEVEDEATAVPTLRRADAHPDAPPRPPVLATRDLGTPFLEVTARKLGAASEGEGKPLPLSPRPRAEAPRPSAPPEQPLPDNLDQPLAAFDPDSIPAVPLPPPVVSMRRRPERPPTFTESERFEIFELTPPVSATHSAEPAPEPAHEDPITTPETDATIHALLARLERGIATRATPTPVPMPIATPAPAPAMPPEGEAPATPTPRPITPPRSDAEHGLQEALVTLRNLARRA